MGPAWETPTTKYRRAKLTRTGTCARAYLSIWTVVNGPSKKRNPGITPGVD
jgi:hypothetical protein